MTDINSKERMTTVQGMKIPNKSVEVVFRCPKLQSLVGLAGAETADVSHIVS
jgi:hypothetical protein